MEQEQEDHAVAGLIELDTELALTIDVASLKTHFLVNGSPPARTRATFTTTAGTSQALARE